MKIRSLILFLLLNFLALYIGSKLSGDGPTSNWYNQLNKAPWTPPGWVFGVAWTTIMICFAIYMSYLWNSVLIRTSILTMFIIQWILNVSWSPIFFEYKQAMIGLMIISVLNAIIAYFLFRYLNQLKLKSIFILPYFIWLLIATSLNAYIFVFN